MADKNPFGNLGMEFVNWQNAPSLTGGKAETFLSKAKGVMAAKFIDSSGLKSWLDNLGKSTPAGAAVPNAQTSTVAQPAPAVPTVKVPVVPMVPGTPMTMAAPMLPALPTIGQAQADDVDLDEMNEKMWSNQDAQPQ